MHFIPHILFFLYHIPYTRLGSLILGNFQVVMDWNLFSDQRSSWALLGKSANKPLEHSQGEPTQSKKAQSAQIVPDSP